MFRPNGGQGMIAKSIMAREMAPGFAHQDMFVNDTTQASTLGNIDK